MRSDILKIRLKASDSGPKIQRTTRVVFVFTVFGNVDCNRAVEHVNSNVSSARIEKLYCSIGRIESSNYNNWDPNPTTRPSLSIRVGGIGRQSFTIRHQINDR